MATKVVVHRPGEFELWLAEASRSPLEELSPEQLAFWEKTPDVEKLAAQFPDLKDKPFLKRLVPVWQQGEKLFQQNCKICHEAGLGPNLAGLWARHKEDVLVGGSPQTVDVDENYIRESVLSPSAKVVKGWDDRMPSFRGKLSDRQIVSLIEYLKRKER